LIAKQICAPCEYHIFETEWTGEPTILKVNEGLEPGVDYCDGMTILVVAARLECYRIRNVASSHQESGEEVGCVQVKVLESAVDELHGAVQVRAGGFKIGETARTTGNISTKDIWGNRETILNRGTVDGL